MTETAPCVSGGSDGKSLPPMYIMPVSGCPYNFTLIWI